LTSVRTGSFAGVVTASTRASGIGLLSRLSLACASVSVTIASNCRSSLKIS